MVTRDGQEVRIICIDRAKTNCPVVALVMHNDGHEDVEVFSEDGRWIGWGENPLDLFFAPSKHTDYINLYHNKNGYYLGSIVFSSEEKAEGIAAGDEEYIATIKAEWEE